MLVQAHDIDTCARVAPLQPRMRLWCIHVSGVARAVVFTSAVLLEAGIHRVQSAPWLTARLLDREAGCQPH